MTRQNPIAHGVEQGRFYPSIFVGLGGAGTTVVEAVYKRLKDTYDPDDPRRPEEAQYRSQVLRTFQFLAVDTRMRGQQKSGLPSNCYRTFGGFDGREWVRTLWHQDEFFRRWWWWMPGVGRPYGSKINDKGAGARRIDGRLCLLANMAGGAKIDEAIRRACDEATDILKSMSVPSPSVSVYICSSLSGGTGSGMFIDLAFLLRDRLAGYKTKIYAFLLTPAVVDLYANDLQRERRTANAYAALAELDFWQNQQRADAPYRWRVGGRDIICDHERPFDLVHLIDVGNRENKKINDYRTVINAVADMIFYLAVSQASEDIQGPLDNLQFDEGQETYLNRFTGERKPRTYGSGAVATLRFPIGRFSRYLAARLIASARGGLRPDAREIGVEVTDTVNRLRSQVGPETAEQLLKQNMSPAQSTKNIQQERSPERARQIAVSRIQKIDEGLERDKRLLESRGYEQVLTQLRTRLEEFVHSGDRGLLAGSEPRRLAVALEALKRFEQDLTDRLNPASENSFPNRRDRQVRSREEIRSQVSGPLSQARRTRSGAASEARKLARLVDDYYQAASDIIAADYLSRLYGDLKVQVTRWSDALEFALEEVEMRLGKTAERIAKDTFSLSGEQGLVVEVLSDQTGRAWLDKKLGELSASGRADEVAKQMASWLVEQADEIIREFDRGGSPDRVMGARRLGLDETVEKFFAERAAEVRKDIGEMTLWRALIVEAQNRGADNPSQIKEHIIEKVRDLAQRALPLWYLTGGAYEVPLDRVTILAHSPAAYDAVKADYRLPDLVELVAPVIGDFTPVEASWPEADYEATIVYLEYGAPLGLFAPLTEYRRAYRAVSKTEQIPLLTDRRFVTEDRYLLTDPCFAAAHPARLAFLVALYLDGTIKRDDAGNYVWTGVGGEVNKVPRRAEAVRHFYSPGMNGTAPGQPTVIAWKRLDFEEQRRRLEEVAKALQQEIERVEREIGRSAERPYPGGQDDELSELYNDLAAVKAALSAELYHI